jgi:nucleotide-binding universal stress UspA family protein
VTAVSRVIVGVSGTPGSLPALRYAAEIARTYSVPLIPVLAWLPPGGDLADRSHPSPVLRRVWADAARGRLATALHAAFGGLPPELPTRPHVIRGEPGRCLVDLADEPTDLLVIGTGRQSAIGRLVHGRVSRYCLAHAGCPVLAVPPSPLDREIGALGLRAWALRRRALHPADIASPARG